MTFGDSLLLNEHLISALEMCDHKLKVISEIEKKRTVQ